MIHSEAKDTKLRPKINFAKLSTYVPLTFQKRKIKDTKNVTKEKILVMSETKIKE